MFRTERANPFRFPSITAATVSSCRVVHYSRQFITAFTHSCAKEELCLDGECRQAAYYSYRL
jgi:hypothetical protein